IRYNNLSGSFGCSSFGGGGSFRGSQSGDGFSGGFSGSFIVPDSVITSLFSEAPVNK
ncbi:45344_t:CDS:2, partial [Gigaspora margarita]